MENRDLRTLDIVDTHPHIHGFHDANLAGAMFADVDLSVAAFHNVRLRAARFMDFDLTDATIDASNLAGMEPLAYS